MRTRILHFLFTITAFISSCSVNVNQKENISNGKKVEPPLTIVARDPKVTLLDTCPPQIVTVPLKTGSTYTRKIDGVQTIKLSPPMVTKAEFFVSMKQFNVEEGLALSTVASSFCDNNGNLWFGTDFSGVSKFDGKTFTNFTRAQGLVDDQVFSILQDKNGTMWFGTWNGLANYDGKRFVQFPFFDESPCCIFSSLGQDNEGYIWVGTEGEGVAKLKEKAYEKYSPENGLAGYSVYCILKDRHGNLWFGTENGLSRYDGKSFKNFRVEQGLSDNKITSALEDSAGNIWLGSKNGLSKFDGNRFTNFTVSSGLVDNNISCLLLDKYNHLWIGTTAGVSEFDGTEFKNYTVANGLVSNTVTSMVKDKEQNIWFTTNGEGIFRYNGSAFISYSKAQGLPTNRTSCVAQRSNGSYWIGTLGKGAVKYEDRSFTTYSIEQGLAANDVFCVQEDNDGNTWFATSKGVSCFDGKTFTTYTTVQGLGVNVIYSIAEDNAGNLWFSTFGGGISMLTNDRKVMYTYTSEQGVYGNANIKEIIVDKNQNKWLSNDAGGVTRFDGKTFATYTSKQGFSDWGSLATFEDTHGNLWFGTSEGVARYDGISFRIFNAGLPKKGLIDIMDIKEDREGNIWVGTDMGVSRLELKERNNSKASNQVIKADTTLSNADFTKEFEVSFYNYNFQNGYPVRDIQFTNSMYFDKENSLWISEQSKLTRFQFTKLNKNATPPVVFIKEIKLNNENIVWNDLGGGKEKTDSNIIPANVVEEAFLYGKALSQDQRAELQQKLGSIQFDSTSPHYPVPQNLVLSHQYNDITFTFSAVETTRPDFLNFQYILEGYSNNWSPVSTERSASFGNIHEGTYTFKLKAQNSDGVWGSPISYTFKVLPPWYRTWWAYTFYVLFFLASVWSFIKWRINALKKEKILLEEKVIVRTHELKKEKEKVESTLSELKSAQAQLIQSEKMASLGEVTAGIAHEIQNPLNFVNNFSEVNNELIEELKSEKINLKSEERALILDDVFQNNEKIKYHGKRAEAIVKNMMQHAGSGNTGKEATDINSLLEKYLRLAYHGTRAKDNSFNAKVETHFDDSLEKINVVPQEIGRVFLNLINNAFYAVNEKQKQSVKSHLPGETPYKPIVSVSTAREDGTLK
jgi:ligand-binding sensor domain-containing protein/signal transduction histidine kinase